MQLSPHISHQFKGIIWRTEIDPVTATIFAEIRNEAEKQVSFASIHLPSGIVNFENLLTDERWLTGIEAAYNGVLLLHNYQSAGSPEHRGLIAVNGTTGNVLWHDHNKAFSHIVTNGIVVYDTRIQPRKLFIADINTGETIRLFDPETDKDVEKDIVMPDMVMAHDDVKSLLPEQPYANLLHNHYYNSYRIVSLHAQKNTGLTQNLYIFNGNQQVFSDILNTGIQKLQPEAFVLYHHYLIWFKNRVNLSVINLKN